MARRLPLLVKCLHRQLVRVGKETSRRRSRRRTAGLETQTQDTRVQPTAPLLGKRPFLTMRMPVPSPTNIQFSFGLSPSLLGSGRGLPVGRVHRPPEGRGTDPGCPSYPLHSLGWRCTSNSPTRHLRAWGWGIKAVCICYYSTYAPGRNQEEGRSNFPDLVSMFLLDPKRYSSFLLLLLLQAHPVISSAQLFCRQRLYLALPPCSRPSAAQATPDHQLEPAAPTWR